MKTFTAIISAVLLLQSTSFAAPTKESTQDLDAAINLMKSMKLDKTWSDSMKAIANQMAQGDETLKKSLLEFYARILNYKTFEPKLARLYTKFYTPSELADLLAFYQSPTGRKSIDQMPQIMAESIKITQETIIEHKDEIRALIEEQVAAQKEKAAEKN